MSTPTEIYNLVKDPVLITIINQIVNIANPDKIILFGSRASGEYHSGSDYDICVLKNGITKRRKLSQKIYSQLTGVGASVDIVVQSTERYEELKDKWFLIYHDIAKYGNVIYQKQLDGNGERNIISEDKIEYSTEEGNEEYVSKWLQRAESNIEIAKAGRVSRKVFYEDLCFECQQAAEKSLKAILISINKKFDKTHNIERLLKLLEEEGFDIPKIVKNATLLSDYATTSRYPGDYDPVDEREYERALNIADEVLKWAVLLIEKNPTRLF